MKLDGKVDLSFSQISYKNTGDLKAQVLKFDDADKDAGTEAETVDEEDDIWPAIIAIFYIGELIDCIEGIMIHIHIINQANNRGPLFALYKELDRDTIL